MAPAPVNQDYQDAYRGSCDNDGSEEPTIVPIILPFKGPPIICWDCVKLPADVKIKTPEFCAQILGMTIGRCPPEDQPKGGGSDSDKPDKPRPEEANKPDEPAEPDDPEESSCSSTITATYVSIFCTITEGPGALQRRNDGQPGCSSLAYSTVTACENVAGSTVITTTTIQPEASGLCMPDTCGADDCSIAKRGDISKRAPARVSEPEPGNWAEPENYDGNTDNLVAGEVYLSTKNDGHNVNLHDKQKELVLSGTFQSIEFEDTPQTPSVHGLFGCTAVFVVSRKGAFGAHIWEGGQTIDGVLNILRGHRPFGWMFDEVEFPHIFISTKRPRPIDENGHADLNGAGPTPDEAGDPQLVEEIKGYVRDNNGQFWGPLQQVNYQIMPYNNGEGRDPNFMVPRGKVLVQYRPADTTKDCERHSAQWRIWIEGAVPGADRSDSWSPGDSQVFKAGGAAKRQEGCAIDSGDSDKTDGDSNDDRPEESDESDEEPLPALTPGACKEQSDCPPAFCAGGGSGSSGTPTCKDKKCVCEAVELSPAPGSCKEKSDCPPAFCAGGGPGSSGTPTCKDKQCVCEDATAPPDLSCKNKDECGNKLDCSEGQEATCEGDRCLCKDLPDLSCSQDDICSDKLKSCEPSEEAKCDGGQRKCLPRPTFASGTCTAHIFEAANSKSPAVQITIYDGKGDKIHEYFDSNETGYDRTVTIEKEKLPYSIAFEFLGSFLKKRDRPEPSSTDARLKYQAYGIKITAGDTHWTTNDREQNELPRCEVGGWDTHESWNPARVAEGLYRLVMKIFGQEINDSKLPTRDMDCRWKC